MVDPNSNPLKPEPAAKSPEADKYVADPVEVETMYPVGKSPKEIAEVLKRTLTRGHSRGLATRTR